MDPWLSPAPSPRPLHIYYRDGHSKLEVMDHDKCTVLYTIYRRSSSPHLTICREAYEVDEGQHPGKTTLVVGQASFHHFKSDIDIDVPDKDLSMKKMGWMSSSYEVQGRGFAWRWERDGVMTSGLKLVDGEDRVLARFENASWSRKKQGSLIVYGIEDREGLDKVVVSGLARVEYQRRSQKAHNGAVVAASSGH